VRKVVVVKGKDFDMKTEKRERSSLSIAENISAILGGDGTCVETEDGTSMYDLMHEFGGVRREYGDGDYIGLCRYVFDDGSAIVDSQACWDIEGSTPFSWAGCE
jgi:hypothetical protein